MARRIYWVSYPEKDKKGNINDFQTLLDWAYEDTVGYSETGVQYVQSQPFSVDFCEEDIILEDEDAAKEYILDEMYPDYSGFDPRAYDMHNCAVRFYREVSKESKKYIISPNRHRDTSRSFNNIDNYIKYLEDYHWIHLQVLKHVLKDEFYLRSLKNYFKKGLDTLSWLKPKIADGSIRDVTEESIRDFLVALMTATSLEEVPSNLKYYDQLFSFVPSEALEKLPFRVLGRAFNGIPFARYYKQWTDFMYDTIDINDLLSKAKESKAREENSSTSPEDNKEVYWLMYIEKRL